MRELEDYDEYLNEGITNKTLLNDSNLLEIGENFEKGAIFPILSSTPKLLTSDLMNRFAFDLSFDTSDFYSPNSLLVQISM